MDISLIIGGMLSVLRVLKVQRSTTIRTAIIALACLLMGTLCEGVLIYLEYFGLGDPRLMAGTLAQVMAETLVMALPFTAGVVALQWLRRFVRL